MKLTVFGAAGSVGGRVVLEARERGHEVVGVGRTESRLEQLPPGVERRVGDASNLDDVVALSAGSDAVVSATRPVPGREAELAATAETLVTGTRETGARLVLVGGAATLKVPGTDGKLVLDDPRFVPPAWRPIALACRDQLEVCRAAPEADWTYLSPPALLEPATRSGIYRTGRDELLLDADGVSRISVEDLAVALVDELEQPRHRRTRFTVAY